jgi:glycine cleavage system aminomethyltransferase T
MMISTAPIAQGPLIAIHQTAGATIETRDGWRVAVRYSSQPTLAANALVDLSHRATWEIHGPDVSARLQAAFGVDVPVRSIAMANNRASPSLARPANETCVYRLTPGRAIVFGPLSASVEALDVTGGWATLALMGPNAADILGKVTALDLRPAALPVEGCCQGPIFGVTTLMGRLANRFELHIGGDSAQFIWEVLLDAGREFNLRPAGLDYLTR